MKLKFKQQGYQTDAVKAVVDCFAGQPKRSSSKYAIDPGRAAAGSMGTLYGTEGDGFANATIALSPIQLLENLHGVQRRQNLPLSPEIKVNPVCKVNLDIEMETGTGKTYCYIKSPGIDVGAAPRMCSSGSLA